MRARRASWSSRRDCKNACACAVRPGGGGAGLGAQFASKNHDFSSKNGSETRIFIEMCENTFAQVAAVLDWAQFGDKHIERLDSGRMPPSRDALQKEHVSRVKHKCEVSCEVCEETYPKRPTTVFQSALDGV